MNIIDQTGYLSIKSQLAARTAKNILSEIKQTRQKWPELFFIDKQVSTAVSFTSRVPVLKELLFKLKQKAEYLAGKTLQPSAGYGRFYTNQCKLKMHKDAKWCEYSFTICLQPTNWRFALIDNSGQVVTFEQQIGDSLMYKGYELSHGRIESPEREHVQIFLHYVDVNGPYADQAFRFCGTY